MASYYPSPPAAFVDPSAAAAAAAASSSLNSGVGVPSSSSAAHSSILHLNVGGTRFSTSRQTLLNSGASARTASSQHQHETFFTALLSGRVGCLRDEDGAIFIDRDPDLFRVILNYLRTRTLSLQGADVKQLLHEAEYYGIQSLVKQLQLCVDLDQSGCGDVLFYTYLSPPLIPTQEPRSQQRRPIAPPRSAARQQARNNPASAEGQARQSHSRNSSGDLTRSVQRGSSSSFTGDIAAGGAGAMGLVFGGHPGAAGGAWIDPLRVQLVTAHQSVIAVGYPHFVACFKQREQNGLFQSVYTSPYLDSVVERVALNAKMGTVLPQAQGGEQVAVMVAVSYGQGTVRLMGFTEEGSRVDVGTFVLGAPVDRLFFIGTQLVALSSSGRIGVWNSMTQIWQAQELAAITSHDTAGSFLLLGSSNGSINYIDMQKFPLRMKDNDLLVTELYRDPAGDAVTAISVYLTPKTSICGNWIEIAYGTSSGTVRVIVQHPETVGHGPQLFQTFSVHRSPVTKVKLSEKYLVSVCCEYNHVRTWGVTRFRGMISTQPGSTSVASFKIISLEETAPEAGASSAQAAGNECGPYGEQDDEQVFVQKVVPETDCLFVRLASDGRRVCVIRSVDGTTITSFCVQECEASSRMGSRPRRFIFTGHSSGAVQMWDLTTALEIFHRGDSSGASSGASGISHGTANNSAPNTPRSGGGGGGGPRLSSHFHPAPDGGPTAEELVKLLDHMELSNSRNSTPCCISPSPSLLQQQQLQQQHAVKMKATNLAFLNSQVEQAESEGADGENLTEAKEDSLT